MGQNQSQPPADGSAGGAAGQPEQTGFGYGSAMGASREPTNKVQFAAMQLGGVPGAAAYHSSILVNGEEYSFSDGGIFCAQGLESHKQMAAQQQQKNGQPGSQPEVIEMGMSHYTGSMLKAALERHFLAGTYDFLRKNCNSFADCALFYLVQKRIDSKYRALDRLGASNPSIIAAVSGGQYTPNPKADGFDCDKLVLDLDPAKKWDHPGQAVGGTTATSAEAMRAARLARLGGGGGGSAAPAAGGYPAGAAAAAAPAGAVAAGGYSAGSAAPAAPAAAAAAPGATK